MPVPRLFEAPSDQRGRWIHVVACLIGLSGPETRPALLAELTGEDLPGVEDAQTRESHPLGGAGVDVLVRDRDRRWAVAVQATLGFEADAHVGIMAAHTALADQAERVIGVVITPDRKPSAAIAAAQADGADARHKSWLRVRDWVQERPERGGSTGVDLALLREAEYFLTPRVAELYRLEELMPGLPAALRPTLAAVFFDLNDVSPAPLITTGASGASEARIAFPRAGDPVAEILIQGLALSLRLADGDVGGGFAADGGASTLAINAPLDWVRGRSAALAVARRLLPVPR
jgi:hypothetical protein